MNCNFLCKCAFTIVCIVCTIGMVGYWLYKFAVEDRDIGVVDYESFEKPTDIPFPVVTFCFSDIFVPKSFPVDYQEIDIDEYIGYLDGDIYNQTYKKLDYWNITMNLKNYFLYGTALWSNETEYRDDTLTFFHSVTFNGFYWGGEFHKCYSVKNTDNKMRIPI